MSDLSSPINPKKPRARPNASNQSFLKIREQISRSSQSSNSDPGSMILDMSFDSVGSFDRSSSRDGTSSREVSLLHTRLSAVPSLPSLRSLYNVTTVGEPTLNATVLNSLDVLQLQSKEHTNDEEKQLAKLQGSAPFSERPDFYTKLKPLLQFNYYSPGVILVNESMLRIDVHWIIEGTCTVTRNLQLINAGGILSEYKSDTDISELVQDIVIDTQELHVGDNLGTDSICGCGVKTDTTVITVSVKLNILNEISTSQLKLMLEASNSIYNFSKEFLVREYLEQEEYDRRRKVALSKAVEGSSLECLNKFE
jgi:hypothetical protein